MSRNIREELSKREKTRITGSDRVPAAVLVPLYEKDGQDYIVFIQRTDTVTYHKGQISFPGGSRDTADKTLLETALRESSEEIGLRPGDAEVLGEMDDEVTTTSNYVVTPFVASIPYPYAFKISTDEVDEIIEVPLTTLLEKNCRRPDKETLDGTLIDSCAYHYQGKVIWGATARILEKLLDIYQASARTGP